MWTEFFKRYASFWQCLPSGDELRRRMRWSSHSFLHLIVENVSHVNTEYIFFTLCMCVVYVCAGGGVLTCVCTCWGQRSMPAISLGCSLTYVFETGPHWTLSSFVRLAAKFCCLCPSALELQAYTSISSIFSLILTSFMGTRDTDAMVHAWRRLTGVCSLLPSRGSQASGYQTQGIRIGHKCLYLSSHLASFFFF